MPRPVLAFFAALLLSGLTACGGDDDEGTTGGEETIGGMTIEITPTSGAPGSTIKWTISGCDPGDDKSASLYDLPLDEYRAEGGAESIAKSRESKTTTGTLTVPQSAPPGDYTLAASCSSTTPKGGGEFVIGVSSTETAFTVTD